MLEKFNDYEKQLLDDAKEKLGCFYPNSEQLEKYLISESLTGNSHSTLATFSLSNYSITLPITTRKYRNRVVSQLYHSEFFKTQYANIHTATSIIDLRNKANKWKPIMLDNSRALLTIQCGTSNKVLNSKRDIKYHIKNHELYDTSDEADTNLIRLTTNRFNIENLGSVVDDCVEYDIYVSKCDNSRKYFTLANKHGEHRAILELQIEVQNNSLVVHYINAYYIKDQKSKDEKTGLNSYYSVVKLADKIAQELGYSKVTIDFGVIFNFDYKLKIPGTILGGNTMIFIKEL